MDDFCFTMILGEEFDFPFSDNCVLVSNSLVVYWEFCTRGVTDTSVNILYSYIIMECFAQAIT